MYFDNWYRKYGKRILDVVISFLALLILLPFLGWLAWKIKKKLGKPIIFSQIRPGIDGKLFRLYKFRSMTDDRDEKGVLLPDEKRTNT